MAISPSNTQWLRIFLILSFFPEFRSCNYHHRCCSLRNLEMNTNCNNSSSLLNLTSHMRSLLTLNNHLCLLFLTFSIIEILGQIVSFLVVGSSCVFYVAVTSIPGLYPLGVSCISHSSWFSDNQNCLQTLPNVPWGTKCPLVEHHSTGTNLWPSLVSVSSSHDNILILGV